MRLLNSKQLAKELGVSTWIPRAVKLAAAHLGESPFVGRYTTKERFMAWLWAHPNFVSNHWLCPHFREYAKAHAAEKYPVEKIDPVTERMRLRVARRSIERLKSVPGSR